MDNKAMFKLSYGLYVLTANENGKDNGCIINTAAQVTTTPNRISIAVNKANHTHDMIMATGVFNVNILSEKADFEMFKHFGFQTGKEVDKFADFKDTARSANGILYLTDKINSYISGKVVSTTDLGTHTLFIADVTDAECFNNDESLTYAYYHKHVKPQPQAAPKGEDEGKAKWRCKICGYVYDGDPLPEDFVCPLCKHGAIDFEKFVG